jgi:hypothetical protein
MVKQKQGAINMAIKFEDLISKVTFHNDTPEEMALHIRSWIKKSEPTIIQKKCNFHHPSDTILKKWR